MSGDELYLIHIIECIEKIERYVSNDVKRLAREEMVYDAVLRNLQTLSEATQRLSSDIKERHSAIEWGKIAGFRNILVHGYLGTINPGVVGRVLTDELPQLKVVVLEELPNWPNMRPR